MMLKRVQSDYYRSIASTEHCIVKEKISVVLLTIETPANARKFSNPEFYLLRRWFCWDKYTTASNSCLHEGPSFRPREAGRPKKIFKPKFIADQNLLVAACCCIVYEYMYIVQCTWYMFIVIPSSYLNKASPTEPSSFVTIFLRVTLTQIL